MIVRCLQCDEPFILVLYKQGTQSLCNDCLEKGKEEENGTDL